MVDFAGFDREPDGSPEAYFIVSFDADRKVMRASRDPRTPTPS